MLLSLYSTMRRSALRGPDRGCVSRLFVIAGISTEYVGRFTRFPPVRCAASGRTLALGDVRLVLHMKGGKAETSLLYSVYIYIYYPLSASALSSQLI